MYWNEFYKTFSVESPSEFCKFVMTYFSIKLNVLDCGCGNGRDSIAMSKIHNVVGIDLTKQDNFICGNFCTIDKSAYTMIYSRFSFHSLTDEDQCTFLNSITIPGTYLCIETRSDKGKFSFRYHGDDHYRNFTNIDRFKLLLTKYNFEVLYLNESDNVAIYKNENPICIQVICVKR
jgi:hypothetical protein